MTTDIRRHNLINFLQSALIILGMAIILGTIGWMFFGFTGLVVTIAVGLVFMFSSSTMTPKMLTKLYGAKPVAPEQAPDLYRILVDLSKRAELPSVPRLFYLPSKIMNAFATGRKDNSYVVISDGLLRALTPREITGVIAHEVAHIRNNDMWVMGIADLFSRLTSFISTAGQFMLIFGLGLFMFGEKNIPFVGLLLLIFAPILSSLLQLGLSRTREYDADLGAFELTHDARGLASALSKLEKYQGGLMEKILLPGRKQAQPSLLRTHPQTEDRIVRLLSLEGEGRALEQKLVAEKLSRPAQIFPTRLYHPVKTLPRWRFSGLWY